MGLQAKTAMFMAISNKLKAMLAVADILKDYSREAIADLQQMGIERNK